MARRVSDAQKRAAAIQAGRRMIARGECPLYRVRVAEDGSWQVDFPGVIGTAAGRRDAHDAARAAIAALLEVESDAFDLEARLSPA